ncbi:MAG: hypothetical protein LWW81_06725 [Rhodocyclales bacterium]|nr:hypothetical protein [Rhodocyclales bacterium]
MEDKRSFFSQVFTSLMIFSLLVGVCTVAFITSWPWEKNAPTWKPEFRLAANCGDKGETCGVPYGELKAEQAAGRIKSLVPAEPAGDVEEEKNWLHWKLDNGIYEVKSSSWHFQTVIRYKIENDVPVLVAYQDVDVARAFTYGMGAAMFMMIGLYLRRLRS